MRRHILTTFYGLYFSHHIFTSYKLQLFNGPLWAASRYCFFLLLFLDMWVLIFVVLLVLSISESHADISSSCQSLPHCPQRHKPLWLFSPSHFPFPCVSLNCFWVRLKVIFSSLNHSSTILLKANRNPTRVRMRYVLNILDVKKAVWGDLTNCQVEMFHI